ncbi:LysR family transcriptional regulator [Stappia sp. TSB10GB4]|uniref:LysR family transcriptional regulator n=1 Tax=Stappia sp. TSB10GB4 TaxID=2003584 RepID=UPI0016469EAF|nr:LysR family transcriptional regulator [Stappia sp. TSB10GB4]
MNISSVDLNLLVAFDALMSERNVTRAARRIGLSQPAMSNALSRLRALFDDELFVRSGRGMEPTARAQSLAIPVSEALRRIEEAIAPALDFEPCNLDRSVRIAMTDNSMAVLLESLILRFRNAAPKLDLHIKNSRPAGMTPMLDDGEIDMAIGVAGELEARHRAMPLYSDRLVGVARRGRFGPQGPTLEQFVAAEHVLVTPRSGTGGTLDRELANRGLSRRVFLTLPQFIMAPYAVAKADLVACLPARIALAKAEMLDLEIFEPPVELDDFTVSLIWHGRDDAEPAHRWLRETVADVVREVTTFDDTDRWPICQTLLGPCRANIPAADTAAVQEQPAEDERMPASA